jgi:hypothetical protein
MLKETNELSALLLQCDTFEEELFQAQIDSGVDVDALLSQSVPQALAAAKVGHIASHHIFNSHVLHQIFKTFYSNCNSLSLFRRACSSAAPNCSTSSSVSTIQNPPPPIQRSLWTLPSLACQHHAHHHVRPCASHNSSPQAAVVWLPVSQRAGLHQRRPRSALKPTPLLSSRHYSVDYPHPEGAPSVALAAPPALHHHDLTSFRGPALDLFGAPPFYENKMQFECRLKGYALQALRCSNHANAAAATELASNEATIANKVYFMWRA